MSPNTPALQHVDPEPRVKQLFSNKLNRPRWTSSNVLQGTRTQKSGALATRHELCRAFQTGQPQH